MRVKPILEDSSDSQNENHLREKIKFWWTYL